MPPHKPVKVGIIALGCAKNLVDAEIMLGSLRQHGFKTVASPHTADVLIVNTCSFIGDAQKESVDTVLEFAALRDAHHAKQAIVVAGCLPQRYPRELPPLLPEVDALVGIDQVPEIARIVQEALEGRRQRLMAERRLQRGRKQPRASKPSRREEQERRRLATSPTDEAPVHGEREATASGSAPPEPAAPLVEVHARPTYLPDSATPRVSLTPRHFAYVKIAEGCNHPCTFCIIPRVRGRHRSRPLPDIVAEVHRLVGQGTREINLISQDSTYYGLDRVRSRSGSLASPERFRATTEALPADIATLGTLLQELNTIPGDFWIRLLYTHPAHWTDALIRAIADCPKVVRYVDLPLQHIHENLLERMRRETSRRHIEDLIRRLRSGLPGLTLRTTFIVGFPGETEACFDALRQFVRETRFERLGVFAYSPEAGTLAARMADQVHPRTRQHRRDLLMSDQLKIARALAANRVGQTLRVLVEGQPSKEELHQAKVDSWERGQTRSTAAHQPRHGCKNWCAARSAADAPDVDGRVYIRGNLRVGHFACVRIVGHTDYDLIAEPCSP